MKEIIDVTAFEKRQNLVQAGVHTDREAVWNAKDT